jgi:Terminase large subunit, endonuclease domain
VRTRGWDVLAWSNRYLPSPSDPSQPLVLSDEQARFVLEFYELDEAGGYRYRRALWEGAKGIGKSPLGAVLALSEFAGPTAAPTPWVQIAAVAEEQAVSNVYAVVWQLLSENDGKAARELGIDLGRTRLYLKSNPGAKLEAVTSAWGTREGQRVTFALMDESHAWTKENGGHRLARVLARNAAKVSGRTLELANAHELGEDSQAERTCASFEEGAAGILVSARRPSRQPEPEMDDETLRALLDEVYGGSPWVDVERLMREVRDPGPTWSEVVRFYFNLPEAGTLAAVEPTLWAERKVARELPEGTRLALGFDGSHSQDGTALVACTEDGFLAPVEILERPEKAESWRVDRSRIERAVELMFERYDVALMYADPWRWQDELAAWAASYGEERVLEFPTNSSTRMAPAVDRFRTAVQEGRVTHDGDPDLTRHVLNARLRKVGRDEDGRGRYVLEKAAPKRLIDACVAAVLAVEAAAQIEEAHEPLAWLEASA